MIGGAPDPGVRCFVPWVVALRWCSLLQSFGLGELDSADATPFTARVKTYR